MKLHRFIPSLSLTLLLASVAPLALSANLYQEALDYQQRGEPKSAIIQLKNLLSEEPDNAKARRLLGTLYLQTGQYLGAEKELRRAQSLASAVDDELALMLIRTQLGLGRYTEAVQQLELLSPADRAKSAERGLLLGHAYTGLGQLAQAEQAYRQAEKKQPSTEIGLSLARLALMQQKPALSIERIEAALADPRESAEARLLMGQAYLQLRRPAEALVAFDDVLLLQVGHPVAMLGRVKALLLEGHETEARASVDQLLALVPQYPDALLISAVLHLKAGKAQLAKDILDPLSQQLGEQADVLHLTGYANLLLGHEAQAYSQLERNLANHPEHQPSRLALAKLQVKQNQFEPAKQTLLPLLDLDSVPAEALTLAGTISLRQGDAVAATSYFQRALEQSDRPELERPLALSELLSGDFEAGIIRLEGLAEEETSPQTDMLLLRAYLQVKQPEKARTLLNRRVQTQPEQGVYRLLAAALEMQLKQPDAAKQHLQSLLLKEPRSLPALMGMAYLALQQQALRDAEGWYQQAQQAAPEDIRPVQGQIGLALTEGRAKTAEQLASEFYRQHPKQKEAAQLYLSVLQRLGQTELLQQQLKIVIQEMPDEPSFKLQQINLLMSQGDTDSATQLLDQLLVEQPDYLPGRITRIRLLLVKQQWQQALDVSQALPAAAQAHPGVRLLRGDAYQGLTQLPAALEQYQQAYQSQPAPELALRLARIYVSDNRVDEAVTFLQQHLAKQSQDSVARNLLAGLLQQQGKNTEAISHYQQLTEQQPEHIAGWNNLAWLYQQQQDSRALAAAEQAYKLAPEVGAVLDTLGWILLPSDPQRALRLLAKAARKVPEDGTVQYHYATALAENGRAEQARQLLQSLEAKRFEGDAEARALLKKLAK